MTKETRSSTIKVVVCPKKKTAAKDKENRPRKNKKTFKEPEKSLDKKLYSYDVNNMYIAVSIEFDIFGKVKKMYKPLLTNLLAKNPILFLHPSTHDGITPVSKPEMEHLFKAANFVDNLTKKMLLGGLPNFSLLNTKNKKIQYLMIDVSSVLLDYNMHLEMNGNSRLRYVELRGRIFNDCSELINYRYKKNFNHPLAAFTDVNIGNYSENPAFITITNNVVMANKGNPKDCVYRLYVYDDWKHNPFQGPLVYDDRPIRKIHLYAIPNKVRYSRESFKR